MISSKKKNTLIYIMGDGRSGSTILSVILGNHPQIQNVGEVNKWSQFQGKPKKNNSKPADAIFWNDILCQYKNRAWSGSFQHLNKAQNEIEEYRKIPRLFCGKAPGWAQEIYQNHALKLTNIICGYTKKKMLVDSSKNMGRAWLLLRNPYIDTRVIHLTRGPRATMYSTIKKNVEQKQKSPVVSMVHYCLKNLFCLFVVWTAPKGKILRVRYEDITLSPQTELVKVGHFLNTDMTDIISKLINKESFNISSPLDGNRLRMKKSVVIHYDDSWETKLTPVNKLIALILTFPFSYFFGYLKRG